MTATPLRPQTHYGNASDCMVGAFLQALDLRNAALADIDNSGMFAFSAYEGVLDAVAEETITSSGHAALAIAAAIWRVEEMATNSRARNEQFDVYDMMILERLRTTLRHLWDFCERAEELTPVARHFGLSMPRPQAS